MDHRGLSAMISENICKGWSNSFLLVSFYEFGGLGEDLAMLLIVFHCFLIENICFPLVLICFS